MLDFGFLKSPSRMVSRNCMVMTVLFCVCLIVSNLFETKAVLLGPITATAGMLVFPFSYIINDCITEVWGFREARFIIFMGFAINFLMLLLSVAAVALPSPAYWTGGEAFNFVFGLAPRITVASLAAFVVGSLLNSYVMVRMKRRDGESRFSLRAIVSTIFGECADSLVFFPIAFLGVMPARELIIMMGVQAGLKTLVEVIILPVTVRVVRWLKRQEVAARDSESGQNH